MKIDGLAPQRDKWNEMRINHHTAWSHWGTAVGGHSACSTHWTVRQGVEEIWSGTLELQENHRVPPTNNICLRMDVFAGSRILKLQNWQMESGRIINSGRIGYIVSAQLRKTSHYHLNVCLQRILPDKSIFCSFLQANTTTK